MTAGHYPSLETLARTGYRRASWWASVARALDDLDDRVRQEAALQPSDHALRLQDDRTRLTERARRLRRIVAQVAGDPRQAAAVAGELSALSEAEDRCRHQATSPSSGSPAGLSGEQ
jgi:hypothetical protein